MNRDANPNFGVESASHGAEPAKEAPEIIAPWETASVTSTDPYKEGYNDGWVAAIAACRPAKGADAPLLPCPFCGGPSKRLRPFADDREMAGCKTCEVWTMAETWNRRASPAEGEGAAPPKDRLTYFGEEAYPATATPAKGEVTTGEANTLCKGCMCCVLVTKAAEKSLRQCDDEPFDTDIHDKPHAPAPRLPLDLKTDPALLARIAKAATAAVDDVAREVSDLREWAQPGVEDCRRIAYLLESLAAANASLHAKLDRARGMLIWLNCCTFNAGEVPDVHARIERTIAQTMDGQSAQAASQPSNPE